MLRFSKLRLAGLQHRKTEAHIYKALQMPRSISGAKPLWKWLTLLLFGVKGRGTSPHPSRGPAQAQHTSASTHTSLRLEASLLWAYTQQHLLLSELKSLSHGAGISDCLGDQAGQAGRASTLAPMEQDRQRAPYLSPTTCHQPGVHTSLCCCQQRFIWHLRRCEIHSGSSQPCCLCFLLLLCSPRF